MKDIIQILVGTTIFVIAILNGVFLLDKYRCDVYASQSSRQVKFSWWADTCYVKTTNGWFDYDQINQNTVSK